MENICEENPVKINSKSFTDVGSLFIQVRFNTFPANFAACGHNVHWIANEEEPMWRFTNRVIIFSSRQNPRKVKKVKGQ